jgi:small subunit ribosomal protein S16
MLMIKLKRVGKKHQPSFRLVVQEKRTKVNGRSVDDVGSYNPATKKFVFDKERVKYWLGVGAQPTATIHNLLVVKGVIKEPKIPVHKKIKKQAENSPAMEQAAKEAAEVQPAVVAQ